MERAQLVDRLADRTSARDRLTELLALGDDVASLSPEAPSGVTADLVDPGLGLGAPLLPLLALGALSDGLFGLRRHSDPFPTFSALAALARVAVRESIGLRALAGYDDAHPLSLSVGAITVEQEVSPLVGAY